MGFTATPDSFGPAPACTVTVSNLTYLECTLAVVGPTGGPWLLAVNAFDTTSPGHPHPTTAPPRLHIRAPRVMASVECWWN